VTLRRLTHIWQRYNLTVQFGAQLSPIHNQPAPSGQRWPAQCTYWQVLRRRLSTFMHAHLQSGHGEDEAAKAEESQGGHPAWCLAAGHRVSPHQPVFCIVKDAWPVLMQPLIPAGRRRAGLSGNRLLAAGPTTKVCPAPRGIAVEGAGWAMWQPGTLNSACHADEILWRAVVLYEASEWKKIGVPRAGPGLPVSGSA
jgi:hypothetical protein